MDDTNKQPLNRYFFGEDFKWGVSTAAFQIEGACAADGKGPSIWDTFTTGKGRIKDGRHAQTSCNFYNNYKNDIGLVKHLGIPNFRFSISWARIMPQGTGAVNQAGLDHYNNVINYLIECGIEPWITLYHWDLPQALEDKGGWISRDVVSWFTEFAEVCAKHFGDRVKYWMVLNEPSVFTGAGYFLGIHAPGRKGLTSFLKAMHHANLAAAEGGRTLRRLLPDAQIGTTYSCTHIEPATSRPRDVAAAKRIDTLLNRAFLEPALGMGYPVKSLPILGKITKYMQQGDNVKMTFDFDFIGLQCYTREVIRSSFFVPYIGAKLVSAKSRGKAVTEMGWEVHPKSLYQLLKKLNAYDAIKSIIITENGAAFPDTLSGERVHDTQRQEYIEQHIVQVAKAKRKGLKVDGYFVWTLTDNFEWAEGYNARFGLVHVDFDTQKRTIKDSGYWYMDFLSS